MYFYSLGQALIQLKFGPLQHCVQWTIPKNVSMQYVYVLDIRPIFLYVYTLSISVGVGVKCICMC